MLPIYRTYFFSQYDFDKIRQRQDDNLKYFVYQFFAKPSLQNPLEVPLTHNLTYWWD